MIDRSAFLKQIEASYQVHPICALVGPRQCGKTTLAHRYAQSSGKEVQLFDLEDPLDLAKLESPKLALENLEGLIVIDEIQRRPDLFPYLRVLVDRYPQRPYLILGSASRELIQQASESLAGRIQYIELTPLQLSECKNMDMLWRRGGFPRSYLADSDKSSVAWRRSYITTFLERDLIQLGFPASSVDARRLWTMLAHYHGNLVNYSEIGRSLGLSDNTIKRYIHFLEQAFMIRSLKPWFENIKKRQVKTPKVYIRDSGLMHVLLNIDEQDIATHPKVGASWEGFALEQIVQLHQAAKEDCYFWATSNQAELDLLIVQGDKKYGYEFKYTDHPKITRSMITAIEDLKLKELKVIIPINTDFYLAKNIRVQGLANLFQV